METDQAVFARERPGLGIDDPTPPVPVSGRLSTATFRTKIGSLGRFLVTKWHRVCRSVLGPVAWREHHIVEGDRLSDLASLYRAPLHEILAINPEISDPNVIYIGDIVRIPITQTTCRSHREGWAAPPTLTNAPIGFAGGIDGMLAGSTRTWQEVRIAYASSEKANGLPFDYHTDGAWPWQCTAWAYTRWRELGRLGPIYSPSGGTWATANGGHAANTPTLGAAASYTNGGHGHVMIVEQISADQRQFRVSEMNVGDDLIRGVPTEYRSDQWFILRPSNTWVSQKTGIARTIVFAPV